MTKLYNLFGLVPRQSESPASNTGSFQDVPIKNNIGNQGTKTKEASSRKQWGIFQWYRKRLEEYLPSPCEESQDSNLKEFEYQTISSQSPPFKTFKSQQRSNSLGYNHTETKDSNDDLLKGNSKGLKSIRGPFAINTSVNICAPLISPISPLSHRHRTHYVAQLSGFGMDVLKSPTAFSPSGPRMFVPEGGPVEAKVGRFTINRESVESSHWKPTHKRRSSRFSLNGTQTPENKTD